MSHYPLDLNVRNDALEERRVPRIGRVFCNRNLRLPSIGAIGFDLDHTLAHYANLPVETLAFDVTKRKLVEKKGYPEEILTLEYDPRFVIRGLVIDKRRGNILKTNHHNYVARAYHGRREIHTDERKKYYRRRPIRLSDPSFASVDTLFHLPEVYLYLMLVEILEQRKNGKRVDYGRIYDDVREMIDEGHRDGTIKSVIEADPGSFVRPDPRLGLTLEDFRRSGKKVFLLTNSEYRYTNVLLSYLLPDGEQGKSCWEEFFDLIVCDGGKPNFFYNKSREAPPRVPGTRSATPVFSGGGAHFLEDFLGFNSDRIIYFGDHTYGDILRSKKSVGWRTAMVASELTFEIEAAEKAQPEVAKLATLNTLRERLDLDLLHLHREQRRLAMTLKNLAGSDAAIVARTQRRLVRLEDEQRRVEAEMQSAIQESRALRKNVNNIFNSNWGSLFREGNETSRFGDQVEDFACLYTARVSNFLNYPPSFYFQAPVRLMPHEL